MERFLPEGRSDIQNKDISPELLAQAAENGQILEAIPCRCDQAHQLHFQLGGIHAVMPRSECAVGIEEGTAKEISILTRVGRPTCFVVEGLEGDNGRLVPRISRRKAQQRCLQWLMDLPLGTILPATVTHLEPFGAFVDVGCGIASLLPLDCISVSRISHPADRFRVGDEIFAVLRQQLPAQKRVLLSHRELMGTWAENAACFQAGEVVTGTVRGVMDYGLFVELAPNLPALAEPMDGIQCGDGVTVFIKSKLEEREKIKLLILGKTQPPDILPPRYFTTVGIVENWSYHSSAGNRHERSGRDGSQNNP